MAKYQNKIKKNITKEKEMKKEQIKKDHPLRDQLVKIIICVLVVIAFMIMISALGNRKYKKPEAEITYDEIIAGQTFNRGEETYYVLFCDFAEDKEIMDLLTKISTKEKLYKVNLKNSMNKDIISDKGNDKVNDASELKINGPTLIKIENNKNVQYVEGTEQVKKILTSL